MKTLSLLLTFILAESSYQTCTSQPGITTCNGLQKNTPLIVENYQNLLEFAPGNLQIVPTGSFKLLPELKILLISTNRVKILETGAFDGLYNLEKLSLYGNLLENVPNGAFRDLRKLKDLNLGMNQINSVSDEAFAGLSYLEEINLSFNQLSSVPASLNTLTKLRILKLNNNLLKIVPSHTFKHLNNLQTLNLADNGINEVSNKAFNGLNNLKDLSLKSNYLSKLNTQDLLEDLRALQTLKLSVNSFKCSTLKDIDDAMKRRGVTLERGYFNKPGGNSYNGMVCVK